MSKRASRTQDMAQRYGLWVDEALTAFVCTTAYISTHNNCQCLTRDYQDGFAKRSSTTTIRSWWRRPRRVVFAHRRSSSSEYTKPNLRVRNQVTFPRPSAHTRRGCRPGTDGIVLAYSPGSYTRPRGPVTPSQERGLIRKERLGRPISYFFATCLWSGCGQAIHFHARSDIIGMSGTATVST
ncbi:hypothetical protein NEOLEDRAFT_1132175 [Neolentinus lepideus HHB14362 ss-1]|uniref:Uncharacterized protein n=1 Tax=Neolentinus lepideus HHB14362 ss-1 TaxID=1314782 RepID=A0A165TGF7_9AGAM|nr:hypothetical protein NEOLEDRAFT_1132175 [Neolentinus lepideus HHB14362 ss-1]